MKTFTKFGIGLTVVSAIAAIGTGVEPILFFAAAVAFITLLDFLVVRPMPSAEPVVEAPAETNHTAVMEAPVVAVTPAPAVPEAPVKKTRAKRATPAIKAAPAKKPAPKKEPAKKPAAPAKKAPAKAKK